MSSPLPKQLAEFLLEQQEPFTLQLHLLDGGHARTTNSNSEQSYPSDSPIPSSCSFFKGRKLLPRCSQFVKAVFGRLALVDTNNRKFKNIKDGEIQDYSENDKFSSLSSDAEDIGQKGIATALHEKQVVAVRNMVFNGDEDSKQLSPVSVLEKTESSEDDECDGNIGEAPGDLQESFQCSLEGTKKETGKTLDSDKQRKLICGRRMFWSQDSVDETESDINHIILSDFVVSAKEWRGVDEVQAKEIGVMICGKILEDICCEIVRDLISFGA